MRIRSLYVAVLAGAVLVPVGASAVIASESLSGVTTTTAVDETFRTSAAKREKRVIRTAAATKITVVPAPAPTTTAPAVSYSDQVLSLTNAERTARGLRALAFSACADSFANSWAASLSRVGVLSHQNLSPILSTCHARGVGENVAYGNVTPAQLVQMWMDSPGHRANILNAAYTHIGVGDVMTSTGRVYGVQVFLTL